MLGKIYNKMYVPLSLKLILTIGITFLKLLTHERMTEIVKQKRKKKLE